MMYEKQQEIEKIQRRVKTQKRDVYYHARETKNWERQTKAI